LRQTACCALGGLGTPKKRTWKILLNSICKQKPKVHLMFSLNCPK
jgi:hypothetical protein